MPRKPDLFVAVVLVVAGAALFATSRYSRSVLGTLTTGTNGAAALRADTRADPAALAALDEAFARAPAPAFRTLRRAEFRDGRPVPGGEHLYTVRQVDGWRSTVRDSASSESAAPALEEQMEGAFDLFRDGWSYTASFGPDARLRTRGVLRLVSIANVEGRLFPLAAGNRLRFDAVSRGAALTAGENRASEERASYDFRVIGREGRYDASNPAVPGPVYLIDVRVARETAAPLHLEVHYAPALGAAVRIRALDAAPARDERLIGWEPAR